MIRVYYRTAEAIANDPVASLPEDGLYKEDYEFVTELGDVSLEQVFRMMNVVDGDELPVKLKVRSMMCGDVAVDEDGDVDKITFEQLNIINPDAHSKALEIIGECGGEDGVSKDDFTVTPSTSGVFCLDWENYGPFNPRPEWMWDPEAREWVTNDDEDVEERYEELSKRFYSS